MRALSCLLDVLVVLAFAAAGRSSHDEGLTVGGVADTAWPFLTALVLGWLACRVLGTPLPAFRAWAMVWPVTVAGGMLLRSVTGDGAAPSFVLVAAGVLGVGLLSWRSVVALTVRRADRTGHRADRPGERPGRTGTGGTGLRARSPR